MGLGEKEEEEGMLGSVLYGQGLGGGQGWRDTQWETVLRLVANLITPKSLFHPLVITPRHRQQLFHNATSPLPLPLSL